MRDGNEYQDGSTVLFIGVFELPMRDGNGLTAGSMWLVGAAFLNFL